MDGGITTSVNFWYKVSRSLHVRSSQSWGVGEGCGIRDLQLSGFGFGEAKWLIGASTFVHIYMYVQR